MPKILLVNGFSFYFFSNEGNEPIHIHVSKGDGYAKFWLDPLIELDYSEGFSASELRFITDMVSKNKELFMAKWNEHFS